MPYKTNADLPDAVKNNIPDHAQDIWRNAFNSAWDEYSNPEKRRGSESQEATAAKVAWNAVKDEYQKNQETGKWEKK